MLEWLINGKQSTLPLNGNKKTTQESTYINENVSEINDIVELPEGIFPY